MQKIERTECYKIIPFEDGYSFYTDNDIWFIVKFSKASQFIDKQYKENIFEFSFDSDNYTKFDYKVANTLISIVKIFFTNNQNILYFICDSSDNRHHGRSRLFKQWFKNNKNSGFDMFKTEIIKKDIDVEYLIYSIVHSNNKYFNQIEHDMQEIATEFSSYK